MITPEYFLIPPLVGALVGYFTNSIAIRMLFRPFKPKYIMGKKVPFTPGLIPTEQPKIAIKISEVIVDTLLTSADFHQLAKKIITEENIEKVVDKSLDAILLELQNTEKLQLFATDIEEFITRLVQKSVPAVVSKIASLTSDEEHIRHILDQLIDSLLNNIKITPAMANELAQKTMDNFLTSEQIRQILLNVLNPANIENIDEIAREKSKGRVALILFFVNLKEKLNRFRNFVYNEQEDAHRLIEEVIGSLNLKDVLARLYLSLEPGKFSWQTVSHFKEGAVKFLQDYLEEQGESLVEPLVDKIDLPLVARNIVRRFKADEIPPEMLVRIKKSIAEFVHHYMERELFDLVERVLAVMDIETVIAEKITNFSPAKLEDLILSVANKELFAIVVLGGVLGFIVGCFQSGMTLILLGG